MSKKNFKTSFDDLLGKGKEDDLLKKEKQSYPVQKSTFIIRCDQFDKLKAIAYLERKMMKDALEEALENYIKDYEKLNGAIQLPKA